MPPFHDHPQPYFSHAYQSSTGIISRGPEFGGGVSGGGAMGLLVVSSRLLDVVSVVDFLDLLGVLGVLGYPLVSCGLKLG